MRKITKEYENPFDNIIYIFVKLAEPIAHKLNLTPNMITTFSVICSIIACYLLYLHYFIFSILFYIFSYFFDCLDGYYARKHNMVTNFGDMYDHISDILAAGVYIIILFTINPFLLLICLPILFYLFIGSLIHLSYQELYYDKPNESFTLNLLPNMFGRKSTSKSEIHQILKYTRYFGVGTLNLGVVCVVLIYAHFYS